MRTPATPPVLVAAVTVGCASCAFVRGTDDADPRAAARSRVVPGLPPRPVREWSGSMHAYAADDPVFVAMNARGQRETGGALGNFCVNCHAPMAVREGLTTDGLEPRRRCRRPQGRDLLLLPHGASVDGAHNNPLQLANDDIAARPLRGPGRRTTSPRRRVLGAARPRHGSSRRRCAAAATTSSTGTARTSSAPTSEWQGSVFAQIGGATCSQCHMDQSTDRRSRWPRSRGAPLRRSHSHAFPAVDLALTPASRTQGAQRQAGPGAARHARCRRALCVRAHRQRAARSSVILDNVAAGHGCPAARRRTGAPGVEVVAYKGANVIYQSGVVADGRRPPHRSRSGPVAHARLHARRGGQGGAHVLAGGGLRDQRAARAHHFDPSCPEFYKGHKIRLFPPSGTPMTALGRIDRITVQVDDPAHRAGHPRQSGRHRRCRHRDP